MFRTRRKRGTSGEIPVLTDAFDPAGSRPASSAEQPLDQQQSEELRKFVARHVRDLASEMTREALQAIEGRCSRA
ncbi:hypothetical protein BH24PSE2_BH24PSE2_15290 [soil metagenome]